MASILKQIRSFAHPHYVTNVLLSTVYYFLKTVPPFCSVLFKDCALEMVICLLFTYFRPFWLLLLLNFISGTYARNDKGPENT